MQDRFEGYLYKCANSSGVKEASLVSTSGYHIPISVPGLWTECSTQSVLKIDKICAGAVERKRHTISLLPRRYMLVGTSQRGDEEEFKRSIAPANFVGGL